MPPYKFATNLRPTLGVEIELNLVDSQTMALRSEVTQILAELPADLEGSVKPELFQCYIEINTKVCESVADAERDLAEKIEVVARDRRAAGCCGYSGAGPTLLAAGKTRKSRRLIVIAT